MASVLGMLEEREIAARVRVEGCGRKSPGWLRCWRPPRWPIWQRLLTPAQCAAVLPRLEAILNQHEPDDSDLVLRRRIEEVSELVAVLRICADKDVELILGKLQEHGATRL
ncbi:hypothetical protein [Streptomyces sp. D2-8]|uniref:hypothetical protein n=1 Tax=Streptomyces sp. D2-8 TaxID=2707767 RepID=UPI0020BE9ADF|nr:hypothetical protein [Streptomyces sp. D2-8]